MQEDSTFEDPFRQIAASEMAAQFVHRLQQFLAPLLADLEDRIDKRLVRTFFGTIRAILEHRHRNSGLLLSELGGVLLPPDHAPAGTKRISNLLRCVKWTFEMVARFLWQQADARRKDHLEQEETPLVVWDDSVNEKSESQKAEGLGPVRSSKAKRLSRIKPGYYRPAGPPVFVPGLNWLCLLLLGTSGPPTVAAMEWWTTRKTEEGPESQSGRSLRSGWLSALAHAWKRTVVHVFDRGYAGAPWLGELLRLDVRFIQRWPKRYTLIDVEGQQKEAWRISQGKRSWDHRYVRDARRNADRKVSVLAFRVTHPKQSLTEQAPAELPDTPLWLVVVRSGITGGEPWYLLTNEPVETVEDAWRIAWAYARRWQIEMTFRYNKSELAMESPRLWSWQRRLKLLYMVTLAYAFLLSLLDPSLELLRKGLLRQFCHRTGTRCQDTPAPLYRLRSALSRLWQAHSFTSSPPLALNSG